MWLRSVGVALPLVLGGCASPYFIHDPQIGFVSSSEVPNLLKSLRCELATYIAANNLRHAIYNAVATRDLKFAVENYAFFEIDPGRWGSVVLDLKLQDTAGTQSGTTFDWKRVSPDGGHSHAWHIGPTLADQSTYQATWAYVVPQDTLLLNDKVVELDGVPFQCYKQIPKRPPILNSEYTSNDFDALAYGDKPELENFTRVRVNNQRPLAGWLIDVGKTLGQSTAFTTSVVEAREQILPAQMSYTFTIQVTGGLDARYTLASPLWTAVGGEASISAQHTSTISIILDGLESQDAAAVKTGTAKRDTGKFNPIPDLRPKLPARTLQGVEKIQGRPGSQLYGAPTKERGFLTYPAPLSQPGVQ